MRAVVQRVSRARVVVADKVTGEIAAGLVVLLAVGANRFGGDCRRRLPRRLLICGSSMMTQGKMNRSLLDSGGAMLAISQFTLYGDARGGRRPSFIQAAPAEKGQGTVRGVCEARWRRLGVRVATGVFQAHMSVELVNDGPVTILVDSEKLF